MVLSFQSSEVNTTRRQNNNRLEKLHGITCSSSNGPFIGLVTASGESRTHTPRSNQEVINI